MADQNTAGELHALLFAIVCGFFLRPTEYIEGLWDGAHSLSSLSEKTGGIVYSIMYLTVLILRSTSGYGCDTSLTF